MNKKRLPLSIIFLTLFITAFCLSTIAQTNHFHVTSYAAEITPELETKSVRGKVLVSFNSLKNNLQEITLNAGALNIDQVKSGLSDLSFEKKDSLLNIRLPHPLKINEKLKIEIAYHGVPKYGIKFFPELNQVYTAFSTSQWMPCVDTPGDRAAFSLNLIIPKNAKVVANGRMIKETALADNKISSRWEQKIPVPTYLYGFAFGDYREVKESHRGTTLRYLASPQLSEIEIKKVFRDTADMLRFYESRAGVKYPAKTYTQVLPGGSAQQEMSEFTVLSEDYAPEVLKDESALWLGTHEFAHQWWGNMVTNRDWTHFWLNEGLANFMTAAYLEHRFGHDKYLSEIERYRLSYEKVRDAGKDKSLVFPDWNKPTREDRRLVYDKGAYVVHLLRQELGEDLFWKGIKEYTQGNWGKSVETKDFQTAMEKASGKNLSVFFDKWVYLKG